MDHHELAGLFSSVWTKFGIKACFNNTVIGPSAFKSLAKIGFYSSVGYCNIS